MLWFVDLMGPYPYMHRAIDSNFSETPEPQVLMTATALAKLVSESYLTWYLIKKLLKGARYLIRGHRPCEASKQDKRSEKVS